jgi:hypothetical protein
LVLDLKLVELAAFLSIYSRKEEGAILRWVSKKQDMEEMELPILDGMGLFFSAFVSIFSSLSMLGQIQNMILDLDSEFIMVN